MKKINVHIHYFKKCINKFRLTCYFEQVLKTVVCSNYSALFSEPTSKHKSTIFLKFSKKNHKLKCIFCLLII